MNIPLGKWSGSDATEKLQNTLNSFNEAAGKQTRHIIYLTYAILFLTLIMTCMVGFQIWFTINQPMKMKQIENNSINDHLQRPSQDQKILNH